MVACRPFSCLCFPEGSCMRVRIRTLLLTVALLSTLSSTAQACFCIPVLDPFHWLFGCGCYQRGGHMAPQPYGNPGYGGYQPNYPGVMSPCAPCAPAFPLGPTVCLRPLPVPAIFQRALDPCGAQCGAPMMPMAQYQPAPMAMVQPQFIPQPQMVQTPMVDYGCDGGCGAADYGSMPDMGMQMMNAPADSGCCGGEEMMGYGQPAMMSPGAVAQNWSAYPTMAWSPQGAYPGGGFPSMARHASLPPSGLGMFIRPRFARRQTRSMIRDYRQLYSRRLYGASRLRGPVMVPHPYGYSAGMYAQPMNAQMGYAETTMYPPQMLPYQNISMAPQMIGSQGYAAPSCGGVSPAVSPQGTMPVPTAWSPMNSPMSTQSLAGDIMGDHEFAPTATAMVPVVPNSFSGSAAYQRASMSRPLVSTSSSYHKSVR